jgi:Coenzyme PQQ synthesis protein D (PqqD)
MSVGPIVSTSIFTRCPDVVCRQVGAESVLVPIRQHVGNLDYVYTLSAVAATVWELLDGARDVASIIEAVCDVYDVDRDTAAADVSALLTDLGEAALISQVS